MLKIRILIIYLSNQFKGEKMRYQNVVLPATGGGAILAGALGLGANVWILSILAIMLLVTILSFIKLKKGEKTLKYPFM